MEKTPYWDQYGVAELKPRDGSAAVIIEITTYHDREDASSYYYDIRFADGYVADKISAYNLSGPF